MDLASVVAALASVGVRVSGSTPNNNIQGDSSRACPTGLAGPEPSGTLNDPGQHFQAASVVAAAAGGRGAWVVVGWGSWFELGFGLGRCFLGWRRCDCGVVCVRLGASLGLGSGLGLESGSMLSTTSVPRCEGAGAASEVFPVRCRGA